jgi:hypothetical protein
MGNNHSTSNNISIYEIIESARKNKRTSISRSFGDSGSDSPKSTSSDNSVDNISSISSDQKNSSIVTYHSNLSLNLDCSNFDIITNLRISDKDANIDHVDLMIGHRRVKATRDGNDLVICIPIPKFILSDTSPLRLDIYPKTQENPNEISYSYEGYTLDVTKKKQYLTSRIEDKSTHIMYISGLVC